MPTVPDVELVSLWEEVDAAAQAIANGVQRSQMAQSVRTSLGKADGAVQMGQQRAATDWDTEEAGIDENGKIVIRPSMSDEAKYSLLNLLSDVACATQNGAALLADLEDKLFPIRRLLSITADYEQDRPIYDTDDLDAIKVSDDLTVTAHYSNGTSVVLDDEDYTLSGTLTAGTSTITATYEGKTATFDVVVTASSILPSEYQQVEWIQSSGTQCIDTGIGALNNATISEYKMFADLSVPDQDPGTGVIMGYGVESGMWMGLASGPALAYGGNSFSAVASSRNEIELGWTPNGTKLDGYCKCGEETKTKANTGAAHFTYHFAFFAAKSVSSQPSYATKCRIYRAWMTYNGVKNLDLIPCYRKSDSVIGMYDIVNDEFHTNVGTGSFTKGSDV